MAKLSTIIVPEVFNPYVIQRTAALSELYRSGIIATDPKFDELATSGGRILNMPFWNDLTGDDENLSASTPLTPGKITAAKDKAVLLMRGRAWKANDLEKALSGDDPMAAIGDLVAEYWARRFQVILLSILKGVFASASMSGNLLDISAAVAPAVSGFTGATLVDATQKLGDAKDKLTGIMMHSMTEASLVKQGILTEEVEVIDGQSMRVKRVLGKRVVVDDSCPVSGDVYTSFLFGEGAIAWGRGGAPVPTEIDRDSLQGDDILINRQHMILHPRGVAFQDASVADDAPTNAELEMAANWARAYENKNIRIVKFVHKLV